MQFDNIYAFAYSPRPGTRASKLADDVPAADKKRRLNTLLAHQLKIAEGRYALRVGREMSVLVEQAARHENLLKTETLENEHVWKGRTSCNCVVAFSARSARNLVGKSVRVRIVRATSLSLRGELVEPEAIR